MSFKIKNLKIKNKIVVAPMASVTNSAFRRICKSFGAGLIVGEMVSDKAVVYNNEKTFGLLYVTKGERPISQQIFGSDKESFVSAVKIIEKTMKPDIIDINMGCPVPKVATKAQAGSALLKDLNKIKQIVEAVVSSTDLPVTVKIRSGWDSESINAKEVAKVCEASGASAITIHARTRSQGYTGKADWNIIKEVVGSVNIPVIGNGDIKSAFDAKRMLDETGCSAVMIGRGILGNPWLIKESIEYIEKGKLPKKVSLSKRKRIMKKHIKLLYKTKNEKQATLELRSIMMYYLKHIPNTKELKKQVMFCKNKNEYLCLVNKIN